MPDKPPKPLPRVSDKGTEKQKEREERRAALLRRNLGKRKMQQRLREKNEPEV